MKRQWQTGFTLIESVVSMLLLAVMSVMAYQAVEVVLSANERSRGDLAEEIRLHRTWQIIANDLIHLRARVFPDGLGLVEPAYLTGNGTFLLSFTRGNDALLESNPTGVTRIRYQLNIKDELLRQSQPAFLAAQDYTEHNQTLLTEVEEVLFEQLTDESLFVPQWPPLNTNLSKLSLPRMIKVTITLKDGSSTSRLFPGVVNDS